MVLVFFCCTWYINDAGYPSGSIKQNDASFVHMLSPGSFSKMKLFIMIVAKAFGNIDRNGKLSKVYGSVYKFLSV